MSELNAERYPLIMSDRYPFADIEPKWQKYWEAKKVYRASDPKHPKNYRCGELAEAEPAVPGWRMQVEELFT
jgi:hypothetical protein